MKVKVGVVVNVCELLFFVGEGDAIFLQLGSW